jgi:hypothetical protein
MSLQIWYEHYINGGKNKFPTTGNNNMADAQTYDFVANVYYYYYFLCPKASPPLSVCWMC